MLSIGRRIERYRILYCWKIMTNLVPNCGISWNVSNSSGVILNEIPTKSYFKTHRMNSFHYVAPRLFNKLPRILRDNRSATLTEWKGLLDEFLSSVPDLPVVPDLVPGLCSMRAKCITSFLGFFQSLFEDQVLRSVSLLD